MIWLVCGGRDYKDQHYLEMKLSDIAITRGEPDVVITGGAKGADDLAFNWAWELGFGTAVCAANWQYYDKAAGFRRNHTMLHLRPDIVIAFPGGTGTSMMIDIAQKSGVEVIKL